jgi:hypothetical protein
MEVKPSKRAVVVWFFEKGPFLTFISITCMYLVFLSIDSLPYVYNSEQSLLTFSAVLVFFSMLSLFYEYRTKKYYILHNHVRVKRPFGVDRADFSDIRDIKVVRGPVHRVMGVGDILIKSRKGNLALECLHKPEEIKREIHRKVSESISRER